MTKLASSFRDPAGFIFKSDGKVLRQINPIAKADFELLHSSGLYDYLVKKELLISHVEVENKNEQAYKTIEPEYIPFISYPYEWSFDQLKDAALTTLRIQKIALKHGMTLKDASAYNIQFVEGKPKMIDTLSFSQYKENQVWEGYRQFCQHFLAPLALASYRDIRLLKMTSNFIDGIPLDLAANMLPTKTRLKLSLASHIHWHAKAQTKHSDDKKDHKQNAKLTKQGLLNIVESLRSSISNLSWNSGDTEWGDYYNNTNYSEASFEQKKTIIKEMLSKVNGQVLWDLGANDGTFSQLGMDLNMSVLAFDIDPIAVNKNYLRTKREGISKMLPILMDLTNPSAGIGWAHEERETLAQRANADCVMALALIHHLAISNNLPLSMIAEYFSKLGKHLIIEFVPKGDSKVDILLSSREDIFPEYHLDGFEKAFGMYYDVLSKVDIEGSKRTLYLLERK